MLQQDSWYLEIAFGEYNAYLKGVFPTSTKNKILKALYVDEKILDVKELNLKCLTTYEVQKAISDSMFFAEKGREGAYEVEKVSDCAFIIYYDEAHKGKVSVFKELIDKQVN